MKKIILASTSPRRKELLGKLIAEFQTADIEYKEDMTLPLLPEDLVKALSLGKAQSVANQYEDAIIIAADSIVVYKGEVLGKPRTDTEAREMLKKLSGQKNTILTGMTVIDTKTNTVDSFVSRADVFLTVLTDLDIERYIATKEPLDKAGAYAIQGIGSVFVRHFEGDFYGAVGLSLVQLAKRLKKLGVSVM